MSFPCANPINCPGTDLPVANLTAELEDVNVVVGYHFERHYSQNCEFTDGTDPGLCSPSRPLNPPAPEVFSNTAQTCQKECNDGTIRVYTVAAGSILAMSQAEANSLAQILACRGAIALCLGDEVEIFTNTAQSCSYNCPQGAQTYTTPAGAFSDFSQAEADAAALAFACQLAALICGGGTPGGGGSGTGTGSGTGGSGTGGTGTGGTGSGGPSGLPGSGSGSGDPPPPGLVYYNNAPQTATVTCGGQTYTYTTPAAMFRNTSLAAANASALTYAQDQVALLARCLSDLSITHLCVGSNFNATIEQTGVGIAAQLSWGAAGMPPGVSFTDGVFSGSPTVGGEYTIIVGVQNAFTGASLNRSYAVKVQQIITTNFPQGVEGEAYSQSLDAIGNVGAATWSLVAGALPGGLSLSTAGVISGNPTLPGDEAVNYLFTAAVTSNGLQCARDFSILITPAEEELTPLAWWKMEEASGNRIDTVNGIPLIPEEFVGASITGASGKIDDGALYDKPLSGLASCNLNTGIVSTLPYQAGDGISVVGWIRRVAGNIVNTGVGFSLQLYANDEVTTEGFISFRDVANLAELTIFNDSDPGGAETTSHPAPSLGTWFFVALHYDPATGKVKMSINDGPVFECSFVVLFNSAPKARFYCFYETLGAASQCQYDEVAIFSPMLTSDQVTEIYNGGAGQTWPLS